MGKVKIWHPLMFVMGLGSSETLLAASCEYRILAEWSSGFTAEVTLTNDTSEVIEGWSVSWSYTDGSTVPQAWNGVLSGGSPYVVANAAHNGTISPNRSTSFGFNGTKATLGAAAQIPELGGATCSPGEPEVVNQAPIAVVSANPTQGNIPLDVTFNAGNSSDADGDALTYLWDFGNGDTSTDQVVTRTFEEEGRFPVSLTVNDGELSSEETFATIVATDEQIIDGEPTGYVLDAENSSLYFSSTRRTSDLETHEIQDLFGSISAETSVATLGLNLSSVETGVAIRNARFLEYLFEVDDFGSEATIEVPVDLAALATQSVGSSVTETFQATLNLHGASNVIETDLTIIRLSESTIIVKSTSPIVIDARDYGLDVGIEELRNLASLPVISISVPVNFTLFFNAQQAQ